MFPILQVGPLAIQVPGLVMLAGLWVGITLSERLVLENKLRKMKAQDVGNLVILSLAAGAIAGRVGYAFRFPAAFSLNPLDLISLSPALLDPWFGLFAGLIAATAYAQRKQLPAKLILDVLTPLLASLTVAWFLSNLASGNGYGIPAADLPWAINLYGTQRHPSQVYDLLAASIVIGYLWSRRSTFHLGQGDYFFIFLALTSASVLFLDVFHATSPKILDGWRVLQILAWVALAVSLGQLRQSINPKKK